jgi:hypothetical protein
MKRVPPEYRLTDEEFHDYAWRKNYGLPLKDWPDFPPPVPQDTFYYQLIMNPYALLYWMDQYGKQNGDYRHSPIIAGNRHLVPTERPGEPRLPRFAEANSTPSQNLQQ